MGKDYFQDITPPGSNPLPVRKLDQTLTAHESRSIREISVERTNRPRIDEGNSFVAEKVASSGMGRVVLWAGAGVGLALLGIAIVLMFRPSTVTVIPRSHTVTFSPDARLVITPRTLGASGLAFDPVSITLEESSSLPAEGTTAVREFATGSLTIQNTFSDTPVKLIENTRFESTEGRIYRIAKAVSVPGK
jgi:hypothetical protein